MIGLSLIHISAVILRISLYRLVTDLQGHLFLRQGDAGAAGDGVLIICRKTDGLPIVQFHIILQHIGGKVCQEVPQIPRLGIGRCV